MKERLQTAGYNAGIYTLYLGANAQALFKPKMKQFVQGRKNQWEKIEKQLKPNEKRIWIHCASLGEFEQGRSLIDELKQRYPNHKLVLTFFSPSGYEIRKNYKNADYVFYLPIDTPTNAKRFVTLVKPIVCLFVKYEFWYNYFYTLHKYKIPIIVVSAIFKSKYVFFQWYGQLFRRLLTYTERIFVQDELSKKLLKKIKVENVTVAPDTRFDRVISNAKNYNNINLIHSFKGKATLVVVGSSWAKDEALIAKLIQNNEKTKPDEFRYVIAPHEINEAHLKNIEHNLQKLNCIRYTDAALMQANRVNEKYKVLILNTMGMLSTVYAYANYTYIGGGFGAGIHNVLEAAVFGMPIFFGPNYKQFKEAVDLVKLKGAFCVKNENDLLKYIALLEKDKKMYQNISQTCTNYVHQNEGGTQIIMDYLTQVLKR